ncbi:MAG: IS66 family transposase [Alphaproteobacteria bacterium]|nr:IS66 family transposase [Alphaproteobacteria bacterium]
MKTIFPLYRQSQRFACFGISLSRSTLCDWVMQCANLLSPLVEAIKERALIPSKHLFSDDTPIRTLNFDEKGAKTGCFWIYTSKGNEKLPACTVYRFTETCQAEGFSSIIFSFFASLIILCHVLLF